MFHPVAVNFLFLYTGKQTALKSLKIVNDDLKSATSRITCGDKPSLASGLSGIHTFPIALKKV
jgi:hypothetical protein